MFLLAGRRMIPRPAQQSGNGRKTWRWVLKACASSWSALSLDYALLENRIVVSFLVGVRIDFLLLKKNTFSYYTCIAALVSLINSEYIYLYLDFLLLKKKTFFCYTCTAALVSIINSEYISLHLQEKSYGLSSTYFFINVEKTISPSTVKIK